MKPPFTWPIFGGTPSTLRGMGFMLTAVTAGTTMTACIRHLSSELHPFEITFFRILVAFLLLTPMFLRHGLTPLKTRRLGMHALRVVFNVVHMLLLFLALSLSPLAKVTALMFSAPLFCSLLAVVMLGEVMRVPRIAGLAFGFAGTLFIIRPGFIGLDIGAVVVVFSALAQAMTFISVKVLSRTESSLTITLYMGLFGIPFALLAAIPVWQTPTWGQVPWFLLIGALGTVTHLCVAQAMKEADATAVMPISFVSLIWAAIIGYVAFAEIPGIWTWIGGVMIFSAGVYVAYRERRVEPPTAQPSPS